MFVLTIATLVYFSYLRAQSNKSLSIDMSGVDKMQGTDFELYVAKVLRKCGCSDVSITKKTGDYGADILCCYKGVSMFFQCKRQDKPVGNGAVQEAFAAKTSYACSKDVVITNRTFTSNAKNLAARTGTILWDRKELERF